MKTRSIKSVISLILIACMLFSSVVVSSAAKVKLEKCEDLRLSREQGVYVYNLVYRLNGKQREFCTSTRGFTAKSKNEKILRYNGGNGYVQALAPGETDLVVKKNGQKFVIHFTVLDGKPFNAKDLKWINNKLAVLAKKYPKYSSLSGKGSTFMKSWSLLLDRLRKYESRLEIKHWTGDEDDYDETFEGTKIAYSCLGLAGEYQLRWKGNSYVITPDSRDFYRLKGYAEKYMNAQQAKAEPLAVKSARIKLVEKPAYAYGNRAKLYVKLKTPLTMIQCLTSYDLKESIPTTNSWKKELKAAFEIRIYRVFKSGRTELVEGPGSFGLELEGTVGTKDLVSWTLFNTIPAKLDKYEGKVLNYRVVITPKGNSKLWGDGVSFDFSYKV